MKEIIERRKFHVIREGNGPWDWNMGNPTDRQAAEEWALKQYIDLENRGLSGSRFFKPVEYGIVEGFIMNDAGWRKADKKGEFLGDETRAYFPSDFDELPLQENGEIWHTLIPTRSDFYTHLAFETNIIYYEEVEKMYISHIEG